MLLKPRPNPIFPKKRLPKRRSMTIALGMLCHGGVVIAADRRRLLSDGTSTYEPKILPLDQNAITMAIADASDDADAAKTLARSIATNLCGIGKLYEPKWENVETVICSVMTDWRTPFGQDAPVVQLIAGILLKGVGVRLYFCKPPNVIIPKPEGYIAAGVGAAVTDPLMSTLFSPISQSLHPQWTLRQIAYLMYRAKKDNAWCGGLTDAAYLSTKGNRLEWVNIYDMQDAEKAAFQLDIVLNQAATVMLGDVNDFLEHNANSVSSLILQCDQMREITFRNSFDKKIDIL